MIRAVCFDFDGTLAHFTGDFSAFLDGFRADLGLTQCDLKGFAERLSAELRREGQVTLGGAVGATLEALEQRSPPDLEQLVARAVDEYSSQMVLLPATQEVLTFCAARNVPLALISNGPVDMQCAVIRAVGLEGFFRSILISGDRDVAVRKPHPRIFGLACTGLESLPEETLMVGDNLSADVQGALECGMQAVCIGGEAGEKCDAVPDLAALKGWLDARL
jgi:putative hydrolase of the HAD superfamily